MAEVATAAVEARLIERCAGIEVRVTQLEGLIDHAA
jgi:hypothetical protein